MKRPKFAKGGRILGTGHNTDSIPVLLSEGCTYFLRPSKRHEELLKRINEDSDSAD